MGYTKQRCRKPNILWGIHHNWIGRIDPCKNQPNNSNSWFGVLTIGTDLEGMLYIPRLFYLPRQLDQQDIPDTQTCPFALGSILLGNRHKDGLLRAFLRHKEHTRHPLVLVFYPFLYQRYTENTKRDRTNLQFDPSDTMHKCCCLR